MRISMQISPSRHAVVVGAGPVGLASALILAKSPWFENITIIEQRELGSFERASLPVHVGWTRTENNRSVTIN